MQPAEFLAKVRARKPTAPAPSPPESAPVAYEDSDGPLDPAWLAEQEASEAATARLNDLSIGDDEFATAVWLIQMDAAFHEPNGSSPSRRIARVISHAAGSGLTAGQLAALRRLMGRVDAARDVLGAAERRRESGRLQVVTGANGRNY